MARWNSRGANQGLSLNSFVPVSVAVARSDRAMASSTALTAPARSVRLVSIVSCPLRFASSRRLQCRTDARTARASRGATENSSLRRPLDLAGGLTCLTDKRKVRRDLADVFSSLAEGVRAERALEWGLVDRIAEASRFEVGAVQVSTLDRVRSRTSEGCYGQDSTLPLEPHRGNASTFIDQVSHSALRARCVQAPARRCAR